MRYAHFDGMCWPVPEQEGETGWALRYVPIEQVTRTQILCAAEMMSAYRDLILNKTQRERNAICSRLKTEYVRSGG